MFCFETTVFRVGPLCGRCEAGYSESLFSTECLPNETCDPWSLFWFIVGVYGLLYCLFFVFEPEWSAMVQSFSTWMWTRCCRRNKTQPPPVRDRAQPQREEKEPGAYMTIFMYYVQIPDLLKISILYNDGREEPLNELYNSITSVFTFDSVGLAFNKCLFQDVTPVIKVGLKSAFIGYLFGIFVLLLIIGLLLRLFCGIGKGQDDNWIPRHSERTVRISRHSPLPSGHWPMTPRYSPASSAVTARGFGMALPTSPVAPRGSGTASLVTPRGSLMASQTSTTTAGVPWSPERESIAVGVRFIGAFVALILYTYEYVSENGFILLKCVHIYSLDQNVLFIDGNEQCYQAWQYFLILFVCVYVVPMFVVVGLGPILLRERKIKVMVFVLSLILPLVFLPVFFLLYVKHRKTMLQSASNSDYKKHGAVQTVVHLLAEPYKLNELGGLCWEGVIILRRLILVAIATMVRSVLTRHLLLVIACLLALVTHNRIQPFTKKSCNLLESVSLFVLLGISMMNLIKGVYFDSGEVPLSTADSMFHVYDYVEVFLVSVIPACILLFVLLCIVIRFVALIVNRCTMIGRRSYEYSLPFSTRQVPVVRHANRSADQRGRGMYSRVPSGPGTSSTPSSSGLPRVLRTLSDQPGLVVGQSGLSGHRGRYVSSRLSSGRLTPSTPSGSGLFAGRASPSNLSASSGLHRELSLPGGFGMPQLHRSRVHPWARVMPNSASHYWNYTSQREYTRTPSARSSGSTGSPHSSNPGRAPRWSPYFGWFDQHSQVSHSGSQTPFQYNPQRSGELRYRRKD